MERIIVKNPSWLSVFPFTSVFEKKRGKRKIILKRRLERGAFGRKEEKERKEAEWDANHKRLRIHE